MDLSSGLLRTDVCRSVLTHDCLGQLLQLLHEARAARLVGGAQDGENKTLLR